MAESTVSSEQKETRKQTGEHEMGWRIPVSIITTFGFVIALMLWLFFYASGYNVYQNIAVVIVMILGFVAVMGATWASWGMRQGAGSMDEVIK